MRLFVPGNGVQSVRKRTATARGLLGKLSSTNIAAITHTIEPKHATMSEGTSPTGVFGETPPNLAIVANIDKIKMSVSATYRNRLNRSREGTWAEPTGVGGKRWSSGFLHQIGKVSEHAATGLIAASALVAWVVVGIATGFPVWWENVLYVTSSSVTVVMVFALQHTQARQQEVTQRKLDELLRAQPTADNRLIALEGASDEELEALTDLSQAHRERALQTDAPPPPLPLPLPLPPIMDVSA